MGYDNRCNVDVLVGKTLSKVEKIENEQIIFETTEGKRYVMYHSQSCCESVTIEDICGDLQDLVESPICQAEESTSNTNPDNTPVPEYQDSFTWTFYRFATMKGSVVIRWYGSSNGYYSESVEFEESK
jgi:proteasome lid subunit RPN8/RPN11